MRQDEPTLAEAAELGSAEVATTGPARELPASSAQGLLLGISGYAWWGVVTPIYFWFLRDTSSLELLIHRVLWGLPVLVVLLVLRRQLGALRAVLLSRRRMLVLATTTLLVGTNWYVFVLGVTTGRAIEASLGYYVNPFVSMALGMLILHERLRPAQWVAVGLALVGVGSLFVTREAMPWISLTLALTFGSYGLLRKQAPVNAMVGLTVEMALLFPIAAGVFAMLAVQGDTAMMTAPWGTRAMLMLAGVLTIVPLTFFVVAAQRLRLVTMGFLQYLAPTAQFALAVTLFGEALTLEWLLAFGLIWTAVGIYSWDALRMTRAMRLQRRRTAAAAAARDAAD